MASPQRRLAFYIITPVLSQFYSTPRCRDICTRRCHADQQARGQKIS